MTQTALFIASILCLLFLASAQHHRVIEYEPVEEEWNVMGLEYSQPLQADAMPYASVSSKNSYSAPIQTAKYSAPSKVTVPTVSYKNVQVPEVHMETRYTSVPTTTYNVVPLLTVRSTKGGYGFGGKGYGYGGGFGGLGYGGGFGGLGYGGGFGGLGYGGGFGGLGYGAKGGFGYGGKGGFGYGGFGRGYGGLYGAGAPFGYYGFPLVATIAGYGFGGHGGH